MFVSVAASAATAVRPSSTTRARAVVTTGTPGRSLSWIDTVAFGLLPMINPQGRLDSLISSTTSSAPSTKVSSMALNSMRASVWSLPKVTLAGSAE